MDDRAERIEIVDREILKAQYNRWKKIIDQKGHDDIMDESEDLKAYEFLIDRSTDNGAPFTSEAVHLTSFPFPLEGWANTPKDFKTYENENWLQVKVFPKDPYRSKIAYWTEGDRTFYATESIDLFLSSEGRGYQLTSWQEAFEPEMIGRKWVCLKEHPSLDQSTRFDTDPVGYQIIESPFEPLTGQNLERLKYLEQQVKVGNIIN